MRTSVRPSCTHQSFRLRYCRRSSHKIHAQHLRARDALLSKRRVKGQEGPCSGLQYNLLVRSASPGFHQQRLAAEVRTKPKDATRNMSVQIREAQTDAELKSIGWLRARSFYAYPPERAFAGQIHQTMIAEEEYKALKIEQLRRRQLAGEDQTKDRSICLVARAAAGCDLPEDEGLLGTLDLYAVRSVQGEVLIGNSDNAAYLANVCVADTARRQGIGGALIQAARQVAKTWGVDALYVHIMAVNEGAKTFYQLHGFVTEQEESSNQAHYRGHCLDGIEGRGRTMLLRDTLL
ncbi:TPA: hypothetical protein ACH3X1_010336 [Trebouxia sp. C0004]